MKNQWLSLFGWIILIWGTLWFIFLSVMSLNTSKGIVNLGDGYFNFLISNILCIGIGSYLIKNFTPEKK
jgi:hypothetical protein